MNNQVLQQPMTNSTIVHTLQGTGVLNISTIQGGGSVSLDGEPYGSVPITITNVEPGFHTYKVTLPGYIDYTKGVEVVAGILCCEVVNLEVSNSTGSCVASIPPVVPSQAPVPTLSPFAIIAYAALGTLLVMLAYKLLFNRK